MPFKLNVQSKSKALNEELRKQGIVPCVVYGGDRERSASVMVKQAELEKLYSEAGESNLIDFSIDGSEPVKVLIQDVQKDPVKGKMTHADFRQINMNKEMTVDVQLKFTGEAPAVKELGGTLVKAHNYVTVKCLPKDLMGEILVDLGVLKTFSDAIRVQDIKAAVGVAIMDEQGMMIAKVAPPLTEDELKAIEEAGPKIEDIEVEKKGKKEEDGEAAVEGEAVPVAAKPAAKEEKK